MIRLYRLLLRVYPAEFRTEFGEEMVATFAEEWRRASVQRRVVLWLEVLVDLVRHALPLHAEILRQDLAWTGRTFSRSPGFALTVVVIAGLGIGANTAVFTVADVVLVRPLPFEDPDRLVRIWESPPDYSRLEASPPNYHDWLDMATSFGSMAAYARTSANLVGGGEPERVQGVAVAAPLIPMLGVRPLLGRVVTEDDIAPAAPEVIVLGYGLWQRGFGGDEQILDRTIVLDDEVYTVIGVMPSDFRFPDRQTEYWTALRFLTDDAEDRNNNYLEVVARLAPGVTLERARTDMNTVMERLEAAWPVENQNKRATVNRLSDEVPRQTRMLLIALFGASLCVLLLACTNLANLILARAAGRRQELAVRSSLGAAPQRLIRQLLTESIVLAALGGILGLLLARASLPLLGHLVPEMMPLGGPPPLDARVLLFAFALTGLTGIGFGALPAVHAGSRSLETHLRDGARGTRRSRRMRSLLVVIEVTASVVLLIGTGLLLRALARVEATDPGFRAEGVLTMRTWLPWPRYAPVAERAAFYDRVLDEVHALPGVTAAAYASFLPIVMGGGIWPVEIDGRPPVRTGNETASLRFITPGWFATLHVPILQGRDVAESDTRDATFVAVVSESFVARYWPGRDPIGRTFRFAFFDRTVVGVVGDVRVRGLERESEPQVYLPHEQVADTSLIYYVPKDLAVRAAGDPLALLPAIRAIVRRADAAQPVTNTRLLRDIVAGDTAPRRTQLRLLGAFAVLAMLLAALGIHGLLSFAATQRSREMGIRMALGARPRSILVLVLREGAVLGVAGIATGSLLGLGAARTLQALLAGVPPGDLVTFGIAALLALAATLAGSLVPALRAARVDANSLLREGG